MGAENCIPQSIVASFTHDIFIKGCQADFAIEGPNEVEIAELYPNETYKTVDECFEEFLKNVEEGDVANGIGNNGSIGNGIGNNGSIGNGNKKQSNVLNKKENKASPAVMESLPIPAVC